MGTLLPPAPSALSLEAHTHDTGTQVSKVSASLSCSAVPRFQTISQTSVTLGRKRALSTQEFLQPSNHCDHSFPPWIRSKECPQHKMGPAISSCPEARPGSPLPGSWPCPPAWPIRLQGHPLQHPVQPTRRGHSCYLQCLSGRGASSLRSKSKKERLLQTVTCTGKGLCSPGESDCLLQT